jgi:Leucine-rich repeat (LRR) protein
VHTSALTAILQTKNLRYLNISRLKYETLPEVISDIWSLQALHVTFSDLVKLPESIGKLQKLRVVNLSCCFHLTSLPDSIGNCVMISSINLFGCVKIATLPSSISRNKRLRVLRLGGTKIERLPSSITTLENLECLDLQRCSELVELPDGIANLKKLVVLNLQGCGMLLAIPKGVGQVTRLEKLGLYVMGVDENDAQISELENVNKIIGELTIHMVWAQMLHTRNG